MGNYQQPKPTEEDLGEIAVDKCVLGDLDERCDIVQKYGNRKWFRVYWDAAMERRRARQKDALSPFLLAPLAQLTLEYADERAAYISVLQIPAPAKATLSCRVLAQLIDTSSRPYMHPCQMLQICRENRLGAKKRAVNMTLELTQTIEMDIWRADANVLALIRDVSERLSVWDDVCSRFDAILDECVKNGWMKRTIF
jgi:hypothetical protein